MSAGCPVENHSLGCAEMRVFHTHPIFTPTPKTPPPRHRGTRPNTLHQHPPPLQWHWPVRALLQQRPAADHRRRLPQRCQLTAAVGTIHRAFAAARPWKSFLPIHLTATVGSIHRARHLAARSSSQRTPGTTSRRRGRPGLQRTVQVTKDPQWMHN